MSNHAVEIVQLGELHPHPHADKLAIVQVFGYTVCVNQADWKEGDLAAYIPPDSIVPNIPEYAFLDGHLRIRAKKLRGIVSFGLLMPVPLDAYLGQNVAEQMSITHYDPPLLVTQGDNESGPPGFCDSKFDIENLRRYPGVIPDGTPVQITEKIHGACARYTWRDDRLWVGSRTGWKKETESCLWWRVVKATPQIESFCRANPGLVLYGEVFGQVQDLRYGSPNGVRFAAFDVSHGVGAFLHAGQANAMMDEHVVPQVPMLFRVVPYSFDFCVAAAEGASIVPGADHVREGCVVKPRTEMYHNSVGRMIFKAVGAGYLLRKG